MLLPTLSEIIVKILQARFIIVKFLTVNYFWPIQKLFLTYDIWNRIIFTRYDFSMLHFIFTFHECNFYSSTEVLPKKGKVLGKKNFSWQEFSPDFLSGKFRFGQKMQKIYIDAWLILCKINVLILPNILFKYIYTYV